MKNDTIKSIDKGEIRMVSGKHSAGSIKIQMVLQGKNVFFARISRLLWDRLGQEVKISGYSNRTSWIKDRILDEFYIEINKPEDITEFNRIISLHFFEDASDWLRSKIREQIEK